MKLRLALHTDAESIARLHAASWRFAYRAALSESFLAGDIVENRQKLWTERLASPAIGQFVMVAEQDESILGFACAYAKMDAVYGALLDNLHVTQSRHKTGIGKTLMSGIRSWWSAHSADEELHLWVLQSNFPAIAFYKHLGAVESGADIWSPPGGGSVPRYRLSWRYPTDLKTDST